MSPLLAAALEEAQTMTASRGWRPPSPETIAEAERLLGLTRANWRPPTTVQTEPEGTIAVEWEAGAHGWLRFIVSGTGQLAHAAVIDGDEYELAEPFADRLPDWARELLGRLLSREH